MLKRDEVFKNMVKEKLLRREPTIGAWLQAANGITAEVMAKAGFDWLMVDMEHGPGDILTLLGQLQAMSAYGVVPFARAPWNDLVTIKRILDTGVQGLLVPYVNGGQEAEEVVKACKYPPEGYRGIAPSPRAGGFGMNGMNYLSKANAEIVVMVAIETPQAVAQIDAILSVSGIDGIFVGPMDLSTSMGYFCNPSAPAVQQAIGLIEEKVLASGKFLGTVASNFPQAKKLYERGYSFIAAMSDTTSLGKIAIDTVDAFRSAFSQADAT
ncbi:MAG: aldolase/citrate lyase family protein [Clostridia bacterium]